MVLTKGCYTFTFKHTPVLRVLIYVRGGVWHERFLSSNEKGINVNLLFDGDYTTNVAGDWKRNGDIKGERCTFDSYQPERARIKDYILVYNPSLFNTPARIFTELTPARIEYGAKLKSYPMQQRMFILLHELGHMRYATEHKADTWALRQFLQMGLNASQAFYALSNILHRSPQNIARMKTLFSHLQKNGSV